MAYSGPRLVDSDETHDLIRGTIEHYLADNSYLPTKIDSWTSKILEDSLKKLASAGKAFKYVVTCNISQKAGEARALIPLTWLPLARCLWSPADLAPHPPSSP